MKACWQNWRRRPVVHYAGFLCRLPTWEFPKLAKRCRQSCATSGNQAVSLRRSMSIVGEESAGPVRSSAVGCWLLAAGMWIRCGVVLGPRAALVCQQHAKGPHPPGIAADACAERLHPELAGRPLTDRIQRRTCSANLILDRAFPTFCADGNFGMTRQ